MRIAVVLVIAGLAFSGDARPEEREVMQKPTKPSREEIARKLTPLALEVTQKGGTERPFKNDYWNNHAPGIYVDIVTGEPLFSSLDKFDSGTGWPSFTRPIKPSAVAEGVDMSNGMTRIEARSTIGDSHLGHVFSDGPTPTGLRYCINSAALRFIPVSRLMEEGYPEFLRLFEEAQSPSAADSVKP